MYKIADTIRMAVRGLFSLSLLLLLLSIPLNGQQQGGQFGGGFGQMGGGGQLWNANNFPNPTAGQFQECRMKMSAHICDPDGVLDESSRYRLDHDLKQLESRTRQDMARTFCDKKGVTAAMAVARKVEGGSQEAVKAMANNMLRKWTLDPQCQKAIVIVVSVDDAKFWVARDDKVPVYAEEFTELFMKERDNFKQGRHQVALSNILSGTWERALSKAGSPRQPSPGGGNKGGMGGGGMGGGGFSGGGGGPGGGMDGGKGGGGMPKMPSIPSWFWIALVCFVIPLLCCCCLCYCCCCKGKGGGGAAANGAGGHQPGMGGGGPMGPGGQSGGGGGGGRGGGFNNFLGSLGGVGAGHLISNLLRGGGGGGGIGSLFGGGGRGRNMGGGGMGGGGMGGGGGGGYTPGAPYGGGADQPVYDDNQGQGGGGLYPSRAVKDEGGGGSWA